MADAVDHAAHALGHVDRAIESVSEAATEAARALALARASGTKSQRGRELHRAVEALGSVLIRLGDARKRLSS